MSDLKGNSCLFCLQKLSNLALLIVSFGFINIGFFLAYTTKSFGVFPSIFIILGSLELLLAFLAICQNNSKHIMSCYVYTLLALIGAQGLASISAFIIREDIIKWAEENQTTDTQAAKQLHALVTENVDIAIYCAVIASSTQILCLLITYCYKSTLKRVSKEAESQEALIDKAYNWEEIDVDLSEKQTKQKLNNIKNKVKSKYRSDTELERKVMLG